MGKNPPGFTTPIFLYFSADSKDFLTTTCEAAAKAGLQNDYQALAGGAVGFISPTKSDTADAPLYLHYNAARKDYATTTRGPESGYKKVATLGYIQSKYQLGVYNMAEVSQFWSGKNKDIATAPFAAKATLKDMRGGADDGFRERGKVLGYWAIGNCKWCNTAMSPTFRSTAHVGCPYTCRSGTMSGSSVYNYHSPEFSTMAGKQRKAARILRTFGRLNKVAPPHMSFAYYCCLSKKDLCKVRRVLQNFDWAANPVQVSYLKAFANVDQPRGGGKASMVVDVDDATQQNMLGLWDKVTAEINKAGVKGIFPRSKQYWYHNTLTQVSYTSYSTDAALNAVNEAIPFWTQPLKVNQRPEIRFCGSWTGDD